MDLAKFDGIVAQFLCNHHNRHGATIAETRYKIGAHIPHHLYYQALALLEKRGHVSVKRPGNRSKLQPFARYKITISGKRYYADSYFKNVGRIAYASSA